MLKQEAIDKYIYTYAKRLCENKNPIGVLNAFDYETAADTIKDTLLTKEGLLGKEVSEVNSDSFYEELIEYIKNTLVIKYLVCKSGSNEETIKILLRDKGTKGFSALKGFLYETDGKYKDNPATDLQILYINTFGTVKNKEDLTSREADQILKSLKNPKRVKPGYFDYYFEPRDRKVKKNGKN